MNKNQNNAHDIITRKLKKTFYDISFKDLPRLLNNQLVNLNGYDAIRNISLCVKEGEFLGVLGRNGAGKSTLLRNIGGVFKPTSGYVQLGNQASGIYELGVASHLAMTGKQFAKRWLELNNIPDNEINIQINDIKDFSELEEYFEMPIRSYSTGMKARLFFSVATAVPAKIFLIDEILSVGDTYFTTKCWGRLRKKLTNGCSGIIATHDWSAVLRLCKQCCIMNNGEITFYGSAKDTVKQYINAVDERKREIASFSISENYEVEQNAGNSLELEIPIKINAELQFHFSYSIEIFRSFYGWETLILCDKKMLNVNSAGNYRIKIKVDDFPLQEG
ncbi:MAG: ATP-binding cassette domain-containing protein, partial [Fulvivirga sp.]|uniref:ABC transporter ATP-binding protein n=1 Tax=Fulvivirga sp. TaxID=1931237 RepID=UPI0032ED77F6